MANEELIERFCGLVCNQLSEVMRHTDADRTGFATACATIAEEYAREVNSELIKEVQALKEEISRIVYLSEQPGGYHP